MDEADCVEEMSSMTTTLDFRNILYLFIAFSSGM